MCLVVYLEVVLSKYASGFTFLLFLFLLSSCAPATTTVASGGSSDPAILLGDSAALNGTWEYINTQAASGSGTVTTTTTYTINGGVFSANQVNKYSDGRADEAFSQTGTAVLQSSDSTIIIHETSEIYLGNGPNVIDRTIVLRNLIIDGVWHPSVYVRVGTGEGLGGVWESPKNGATKAHLTLDLGSSTFTLTQFAVDSTDAVTGDPISSSSGSLAWDGSELSFPPSTSAWAYKLLTNQLLEMTLPSNALIPVFHKL